MPIFESKRGSLTEFIFTRTRCVCQAPLRKKAVRLDDIKMATLTRRWTRSDDGSAPFAGDHEVFEAGALIGQLYQVQALIGEGGMGAVYRAKHLTTNRTCAVKVLYRNMINEDNWKRFQLEAKAISVLSHPCFVQVYDLALHKGQQPFYAMDYLTGATLETILRQSGPLAADEALEVFVEIADGLAFAHAGGFVHRDLKPANIFLERLADGSTCVKILDFGIVKLIGMDRREQSLTGLGELFGTPYYMSPEQCMGDLVDARSDIYSLGCTLFEAISGRTPFVGPGALDLVHAHINMVPPRLADVTDAIVPEAVEILIEKCLAKNPEDRYRTMRHLISHMRLILKGEGSQIEPISLLKLAGAGEVERAGTSNTAGSDSGPDLPGRFGWKALVAVIAVTAGIFVVAVSFAPKQGRGALSAAVPVPAQRKNPGGEAADDQAPRQQEIPPPFFSHPLAGGGTSFSFPARKESIGQWSIDGNGYKEVVAPFVVPPQHRLFFKAGAIFSEHPVFFGGFRADDLGGLSFHRALTWNSKHFAQVSRLKSLKEISFSGLLLKATDLECVDQLPALLHLAVSYTGLKGGALAKLACLGRLTNLEANNIEDITTLLVRLRNNTVLDHLSVKECGLTDSDMKIIGTMGGLRTLCIYDNPVTITGLRSIVGLNVLDTLRTDQEFGPQVIDIVGHFKHLLRLRVSTAGWSQADRQRLRQVLPGACTIEGL